MELIGWFAIVRPEKDSGCASVKLEKLDKSFKSEGSEPAMSVRRTQGAGSKPTESIRVMALMITSCLISFNLTLRRPRGGTRPSAVYFLYETDGISPGMKDSSSVLIWIIRERCTVATSSKNRRRRGKERGGIEDG